MGNLVKNAISLVCPQCGCRLMCTSETLKNKVLNENRIVICTNCNNDMEVVTLTKEEEDRKQQLLNDRTIPVREYVVHKNGEVTKEGKVVYKGQRSGESRFKID